MRLLGLSPKLTETQLRFACPKCPLIIDEDGWAECTILLPLQEEPRDDSKSGWGRSGDSVENLTLTPSIWHRCKGDPHFFIRNGDIVFA